MSTAIPLRCRCGAVQGTVREVSPSTCCNVVCYCRDCLTFARYLGEAGIVDAHGGTPIVQFAPSQVEITTGFDRLRSLRLSPKGLLRWYTDCCRTPIGNMVSAKVPFVGMPRVCLPSATAADVGPAVGVNARSRVGGVPEGAHAGAPVGLLLRISRLMFGWWIRGKGRPSPFFDPGTGAPKVTPHVLSLDERRRLEAGGASAR